MEGDSGLGLRKWSFYEQQPLKGSLGLQLTSSGVDRDSKSFSGGQAIHGNFLQSNCRIPESSSPMEFMRDGWMHQRDKLIHALQVNPHLVPLSEPSAASNPLQISQPQTSEIPKPENDVRIENVSDRKKTLKKRSEDSLHKSPKPKKGKKVVTQKMGKNSYFSQIKPVKSTGFVINGVDIDITGIPIPVCTCTGSPQQCYKWGCGGWQSACCTTSISMYPLPMSTKRKGARIAGRKMSQGAFKKVMEKLAAEGYNFSSPIDLKTHWAKHGTNKFVTIR